MKRYDISPITHEMKPYEDGNYFHRDEVQAEINRLRDALECLVLVVGLTAFKYEGQRSALQEAVNYAQTALVAGKE
jgi:hypothetical protein